MTDRTLEDLNNTFKSNLRKVFVTDECIELFNSCLFNSKGTIFAYDLLTFVKYKFSFYESSILIYFDSEKDMLMFRPFYDKYGVDVKFTRTNYGSFIRNIQFSYNDMVFKLQVKKNHKKYIYTSFSNTYDGKTLVINYPEDVKMELCRYNGETDVNMYDAVVDGYSPPFFNSIELCCTDQLITLLHYFPNHCETNYQIDIKKLEGIQFYMIVGNSKNVPNDSYIYFMSDVQFIRSYLNNHNRDIVMYGARSDWKFIADVSFNPNEIIEIGRDYSRAKSVIISNIRELKTMLSEPKFVDYLSIQEIQHLNIDIPDRIYEKRILDCRNELECLPHRPILFDNIVKKIDIAELLEREIILFESCFESTILYLINLGCKLTIPKNCVTKQIAVAYFDKYHGILDMPDDVKQNIEIHITH